MEGSKLQRLISGADKDTNPEALGDQAIHWIKLSASENLTTLLDYLLSNSKLDAQQRRATLEEAGFTLENLMEKFCEQFYWERKSLKITDIRLMLTRFGENLHYRLGYSLEEIGNMAKHMKVHDERFFLYYLKRGIT